MKKNPQNLKFKKSYTPNIKKLKGNKGNQLTYFSVGLRSMSNNYFSYEQLESARRAIARLVKPKDRTNRKNQKVAASQKKTFKIRKRKKSTKRFMIIRSTIVNPFTKKPLQVRMGKGKGAVDHHVYTSKSERVLLELSRKKYTLGKIKFFFDKAAIKLPGYTRLAYSRNRKEKNFKKKQFRTFTNI